MAMIDLSLVALTMVYGTSEKYLAFYVLFCIKRVFMKSCVIVRPENSEQICKLGYL